jgi:predicted nucleotidyltransferase component of viral defense system
MAFLSPLKKSELSLLKDKATELGCNVSYLEKDYYLVCLIKCMQEMPIENGEFIFTGGTALAKGYKLIERFSEDCDFIFLSPNGKRSQLSEVRDKIEDHIKKYGFIIKNINSQNSNKNQEFEIEYIKLSEINDGLRSELKLEIIHKDSLMTMCQKKPVQSFLSECKQEVPEVSDANCLSLEEIFAGKLSALVWRTLDKTKEDDPRLIRHLYDLSALPPQLSTSQEFKNLCVTVLTDDLKQRAKPAIQLADAIIRIVEELNANPTYKQNYKEYLENFIYEPLSSNLLAFEDAIDKLKILLKSLEN